jgi:hypothetical protein
LGEVGERGEYNENRKREMERRKVEKKNFIL